MKKYLMLGAVGLMMGASFTSCSNEKNLYDPEGQAKQFLQTYQDLFIQTFGEPASNQTWGFGDAATSRSTRAITVNGDAYDTFTFPTAEQLATAFPAAVPADAEEVADLWDLYKDREYENPWSAGNYLKPSDLWAVYANFIGEGHNLKITSAGEVSVGASYQNIVNNEYLYYNVYVDVDGDVTIKRAGSPHFNLYILNGNVTLPADFGEMSGVISVAEGATLNDQRNSIAANGGVWLYNRGTINATNTEKYDIGNKATVYNEGTFTVTGPLSYSPGAGNTSYFINFGDDAVLTAPSMTMNSTCHFFTEGTVNIAGETAVTQQYITWINNGHYTTGSMRFSAKNTTFYNYCQLKVNDVCMFLDGTFHLMDNSYAEVGKGMFNNFYVTMGNNSGMNILNGSKWGRQAQGTFQGFKTVNADDVAYVRIAGQTYIPDHKGGAFHVQGANLTLAYENVKFFTYYNDIGQYSSYDGIGYWSESTAESLADAKSENITWDLHDVTKVVTGSDFAATGFTLTEGSCSATWNGTTPTAKYRIIAEDLTVADAAHDFDFNDVVFDVEYTSDTEATVTLRAAGGTLPLTVAGQEVHQKFGVEVYEMVNTGAGPSREPVSFNVTSNKSSKGGDIEIKVNKGTEDEPVWITLEAERGFVASKICVSTTFDWCSERQGIDSKYSLFPEWVKDPSVKWY